MDEPRHPVSGIDYPGTLQGFDKWFSTESVCPEFIFEFTAPGVKRKAVKPSALHGLHSSAPSVTGGKNRLLCLDTHAARRWRRERHFSFRVLIGSVKGFVKWKIKGKYATGHENASRAQLRPFGYRRRLTDCSPLLNTMVL